MSDFFVVNYYSKIKCKKLHDLPKVTVEPTSRYNKAKPNTFYLSSQIHKDKHQNQRINMAFQNISFSIFFILLLISLPGDK